MRPAILTPFAAEKAERDRVAARAPHLALVGFTPPAPKPPEPDHFTWRAFGEALPEIAS